MKLRGDFGKSHQQPKSTSARDRSSWNLGSESSAESLATEAQPTAPASSTMDVMI